MYPNRELRERLILKIYNYLPEGVDKIEFEPHRQTTWSCLSSAGRYKKLYTINKIERAKNSTSIVPKVILKCNVTLMNLQGEEVFRKEGLTINPQELNLSRLQELIANLEKPLNS